MQWDRRRPQLTPYTRYCAAFHRDSGQLRLGDTDEHQGIGTFLCDAFNVMFDLNRVGVNGWPKVYENGGRRWDIAEQDQCEMIDLHFYEDGACRLTLSFATGRYLALERFMFELVVPFFFRLAYIDLYGLSVAREDLWGEYSRGDAGVREYQGEILQLADTDPGRNTPCPCGNGLKQERCRLNGVEAVARSRLRYQLSRRKH